MHRNVVNTEKVDFAVFEVAHEPSQLCTEPLTLGLGDVCIGWMGPRLD